MWKLLSGIALVVLLDVAFIWMMAAEADAPEMALAVGPTAAVPVIHEQPETEPVAIDDSVEPEVEDRRDVEYARDTRSTGRRFAGSNRVAQPEGVTVSATAPPNLFKDTIIWIGRTEVPVKIDQREEAPIISEPKQIGTISASIAEPAESKAVEKRKRSFQSKAFSVIKKPYDWMKSAVDKLH